MNKTIVRALKKFGMLDSFNLTVNTVVNQQRVKVPLMGDTGRDNLNITEPWMTELLSHILEFHKNESYIDVGVNLGQTLIKLRTVNKDIPYYGFEPNPHCVNYVRKLIKLNDYKNVTIFPVGISGETGVYELSFFSEGDTDSAASIVENFRDWQKTYRKEYIPCFTVSVIAQKYKLPKIGILKIDVEGAEKEVIEGFGPLIQQDRPFIQLEVLPVYKQENKDRLDRQEWIENFLRQVDYKILRIHTTENNRFAKLEELQTIGIHSNMKWCEYLMVPASEKDTVMKSVSERKA